jgi:flagellar motor switch protein FliN/FliY
MSDDDDKGVMDEWADALAEAGDVSSEDTPDEVNTHDPLDGINPVSLETLQDTGGVGGEEVNLDVILDVPVSVSMQIGSTNMNIRNLLQLNQGSVIELDRLAGEPLDVLVNGTLIAHGEVVVVNEKFGIRLTDIISPTERVRKLG